jgi:hypothetical protein
MSATEKQQGQAEGNERERDARVNGLIGRWLLLALGTPAGFFQVQVRPLWDRHYRVNVLVGDNAASARVVDSFFLRADQEGQIISASPEVAKRYGPGRSEQSPSHRPNQG